MRGVDILLSLPTVDSNRIILIRSVASGGDPAAITAALNSRIAAVIPFGFGQSSTKTVETVSHCKQEMENYAGSGS